jgi:uncharacterized membrane protein
MESSGCQKHWYDWQAVETMRHKQNQSGSEEQKRGIPASIGRQVLYGLTGAVLYGILYWLSSRFPIFVLGVTLRPAVAILVFFGIAYGPWAGIVAGFIGHTLGDLLLSREFFWNWSLGYALVGMIASLFRIKSKEFGNGRQILKAIFGGTLGITIGMMIASLGEIIRSGIDPGMALVEYFPVAFLGNFPSVIVLLPFLMILFAAVVSRRDR